MKESHRRTELFVSYNNDAKSSRMILNCMLLLIDLNDIVQVHCIKSWVNQLILNNLANLLPM